MYTEFELISCKYAFLPRHISNEETKWWKLHLLNNGFDLKDDREIFKPFDGESAQYLNQDIGTDELRIRRWEWIDYLGNKHEILDMNDFPGDNESGIIIMDGNHILNNGDTSLTKVNTCILGRFIDRINFFEQLRTSITDYEDYGDDINDDISLFINSEKGKSSIEIEQCAHKKYRKEIDGIYTEHKRLETLYLNEFKFISYIRNNFDIATKLNYKPQEVFRPGCPSYKFIKWNYNGNDYLLVTIDDNFYYNTYLLESNDLINLSPIKYKMLSSYYLSENYDMDNLLLEAFTHRVHSYLRCKRDH